jgi:DNA-binding CsgD family transcriptional regulator
MSAVPHLPLRGRHAQLAALEHHLQRARSGAGSVVIIEGGPGLGKTVLLQTALAGAESMAFRTGWGTADPIDGVVELAALIEALFDGAPPLLDRAALSEVHASREQRFWLLHDIQALLEQAALEGPLLICLDDLQWADSGTAAALRSLPQRLVGVPVVWFLATRPRQGSSQVVAALAELVAAGADSLQLGPLDHAAVVQIVVDILGAEPDEDLLRRAQRSQGNPFLLVELIRGLKEECLVAVDSGRATLIEDRLPSRVSDDMRRRLARMPDPAERVATCASSLGRRFAVADLAAMSGLSVSELVLPIRELTQADVLVESGDRLTFGHDLIRGAVRASVPAAMRRALDRRGVEVLLARGALPVEVATQLAASAEPGDDIAIATLLDAAEALGATDPAASAGLAQQALKLTAAHHPLRGPLVSRRAVSLFAAGLSEQAKTFADTALREALPPAHEAEVRLSIATMFDLSPDVRADNARTALALPDLPADLRGWLAALLFHNLVVAGRTDEALTAAPELREVVDASEGREGRFAFELAHAGLDYQLSRFDSALRRVDFAARIGTSANVSERLLHYFRCWPLAAVDRFAEALAGAQDGIASAMPDRQNWALHIFETWKGLQDIQTGRLPDAAAALEGRFTLGEAHRVVGIIDAANLSGLGRVRIHTGEERRAREVAEICQVVLAATAPGSRRHAAWCLASHAMAQGNPHDAHQWLCALGTAERLSIFPLFPHDIANDAELVRIAMAAGDDELVQRAVDVAEQRHGLNPRVQSLQAIAAHVGGLARHCTDDLEVAARLLHDASRPLALASALEDLGCARVDDGATASAIDAFDRALAINVHIGASWDAARIRSRLRRLGVRRRIVAPDRPRVGWPSLTRAERHVAQLVTEGKTNREIAEQLFVSPHTVSAHLRRIFDKMGVKSRVELTRSAAHPAE